MNLDKIIALPKLVWDSAKAWLDDEPFRLSAIVAYYAVLSLPGLLVIIINLVGSIWGGDIVQGKLDEEIGATMGPQVAEAVRDIIANSRMDEQSWWATILGIGILIYGATGVFYQLQLSLNRIWNIRLDPEAGWTKILRDRAAGFAFVLVIGFLLLVSMVASAGIGLLSDFISDRFPDTTIYIVRLINIGISLVLFTGLFAMMFKYLPDAHIKWKSVWIGAAITSILFTVGKYGLGVYFGTSEPGSAYGAAGSLILLLLWVSYSSLILFYGAKFTFLYAERFGEGVEPTEAAIKAPSRQPIG